MNPQRLIAAAWIAFAIGACGSNIPTAPSLSPSSIVPSGDAVASFGAGSYIVNIDIPPGRYFSDAAPGCYWERRSSAGVIANDSVLRDADQVIVDIAITDTGFATNAECSMWARDALRTSTRADITPGIWLVGAQVRPGTYQAKASAGCYWERLRGFGNDVEDVIANYFVSSAGLQTVTIGATDVGFKTDAQCGTWTRVSATGVAGEPIRDHLQDLLARERHRRAVGLD